MPDFASPRTYTTDGQIRLQGHNGCIRRRSGTKLLIYEGG
ncbi:hypothetical protein FOWG_17923 [Fusarium oxysporum f. sp. lycopersici MN25]|nr:hypothetical protein FOWG_17923 [Fusarium oxysporum f. sp. lycopersici MN25]